MKKVVLALAVVFSVALVSCSSKENKTEDTAIVDSPAVENVDSTAVDSPVADTVTVDSPKAE